VPGGETPTSLSYAGGIVIPTEVSGSGDTTAAPAAGATIASVSVVPGEYTVEWQVGLASTPGTGDQDNFGLYVGATLVATSSNPGAAGEYPQGPVVVLATANTTLAIKAIGVGTALQYSAQLTAVPYPVVSPDDPLYPYNALTANGTTLTITTTPSAITNVIAGVDLAAQAECQVFRGTQVASGSTDYGPVDTTYLPTQAQILTAPNGQPGSGQYAY
jgi:hypothetical protein